MSEHTEQTERAFQKQPNITAKHGRWTKNVGLGFKTPKEASQGHYIDKKCPFVGDVQIRGRILKGIVKSAKMNRTIVVRRDFLHFVKKYQRYEKRHKNFSAHASPAFRINEGDQVVCGECRPLSKTVRYNVLKIDRAAPQASVTGGKSFG